MATFGPLGDAEFLRSVGGGLMDSANRGVTATIGAPVDAAAAALNLLIAGGGAAAHGLGLINASQLPSTIDAPVGGSEWIGRLMQEAGMVSSNRNPIAEALMAALLPGAMAKAGPKVFAAEQALARNAAAPNTMGPMASQRGAVRVPVGTKAKPFTVDDADELFESGVIAPHGVRDKGKFNKIADDMAENGWTGRPILAFRDDSGAVYGLTGSHRIAAARDAGIDVPVMFVDESIVAKKGDKLAELFRSGNDNDLLSFFKATKDKRSAELMRQEVDQ